MNRILKLPFRWLAGGVAVVLLGVSALFHGLAPVPVSHHGAVSVVGTAIHGGPWDVTIVAARLLASQDGLRTTTDGDHWIEILASVDVTANDSQDNTSDILRLTQVAGLDSSPPDRILLARDATAVDYLNPGMPEKVAFLWEQKASAAIPTTVNVVVNGEYQYPFSFNGNELVWSDPAPMATVSAPVVDKRA